ncbi:MAG: DUF3108 domain-containing protein [Epsilonproteobacteria bacterium]|nr:DUF3108 domain-containing protein [Campylobacterota bacterium]
MKSILTIFAAVLLFGMSAEYEATYGWFGKIATAKGEFDKNKTSYTIKTSTSLCGFAKKIADIKQSYISTGFIKNNILYPLTYKNIIIRNSKKYEIIYTFDYNASKIYKTKYALGKFVYKKTLPYFCKNDILSLYFNLPQTLHSQKATLCAVGGEKHTGKVIVEILKKGKITKLKANLFNKVFEGDKGILYLDINTSNWVTIKGKVKNVLKLGDLKGRLVKLKPDN